MSAKAKRKLVFKTILLYVFLLLVTIVMIYPLLWLVFSSVKDGQEIFASINLWPKKWDFYGYVSGWTGLGNLFGYGKYMANGAVQTIPTVLLTIISSITIGYGFARFNFTGKRITFGLMIATMMLPNAVLIVPRYLLFRDIGILNTYWPWYLQAILGTSTFFNYLMIQFFRGIPKEMDESAKIDGCNSLQILFRILLPLAKSSVISVIIFQFLWTWNDFYNSLIYLTANEKFNAALGLRSYVDNQTGTDWNKVLAMGVVSVLPSLILYAFFQNYFVEGVATSGLKG